MGQPIPQIEHASAEAIVLQAIQIGGSRRAAVTTATMDACRGRLSDQLQGPRHCVQGRQGLLSEQSGVSRALQLTTAVNPRSAFNSSAANARLDLSR